MGGRGASAFKGAEKITQDQFLARRGLSSPMSDFMLDKGRSNPMLRTDRGEKAFLREADAAADRYKEQRAAAIREYKQLVADGKIVQPTDLEKRLKTAQGHEDNEATQAARRRLEKQGIDWRTGKKLR